MESYLIKYFNLFSWLDDSNNFENQDSSNTQTKNKNEMSFENIAKEDMHFMIKIANLLEKSSNSLPAQQKNNCWLIKQLVNDYMTGIHNAKGMYGLLDFLDILNFFQFDKLKDYFDTILQHKLESIITQEGSFFLFKKRY